MSRGVMCIAICALSFAAAVSASAQSRVRSDARAGAPSGQSEPPPSILRAAPTSLTQPYVPPAASAASAPGAGLLVDDGAARVAPGPAAGITVTSRAPLPPTAADGLGAARSVIIVTNGKGTGRE